MLFNLQYCVLLNKYETPSSLGLFPPTHTPLTHAHLTHTLLLHTLPPSLSPTLTLSLRPFHSHTLSPSLPLSHTLFLTLLHTLSDTLSLTHPHCLGWYRNPPTSSAAASAHLLPTTTTTQIGIQLPKWKTPCQPTHSCTHSLKSQPFFISLFSLRHSLPLCLLFHLCCAIWTLFLNLYVSCLASFLVCFCILPRFFFVVSVFFFCEAFSVLFFLLACLFSVHDSFFLWSS